MASLSIVTICYNCLDDLKTTVGSVLLQSPNSIEHIIIDGGSVDGTAEWIERNEELFDITISEPDDGRYDAMNKGLQQATGTHVMFLNAGDSFKSDTIVSKLLRYLESAETPPTILSGKLELSLGSEPLGLTRPWKAGPEGDGLPHAATLIDRKVHQEYPYDEQYNYVADHELWYRLRSEDLYNVMYIDEIVTLFDAEGVSNSPSVAYSRYLERYFVEYSYGSRFTLRDAMKLFLVPLIRQLLRSLMGQKRFVQLLRYRWLLKSRFKSLCSRIKTL